MSKLKYLILAILLIIINLSFLHKFEIKKTAYDKNELLKETTYKMTTKKSVYSQEIGVYNNKLKHIDFYFNGADVEEKNGKYTITIYQKDKKILEKKIQYNQIDDSAKYRLSTNKLQKGDYKIVITYKGKKTNFSPLVDKNDEETLKIQYLYRNTKKQIFFYLLMTISTIAIFVAFYILDKKKNLSIEKRFLIIGVPIFTAYL